MYKAVSRMLLWTHHFAIVSSWRRILPQNDGLRRRSLPPGPKEWQRIVGVLSMLVIN
jgi:hypothetical protein